MNRTERSLVAVNAALGVVLVALVAMAPSTAIGQPSGGQRPRGDYTMVSGKTTGGNANTVYIVDAINQEMVALRWDAGRKTFAGVGYRDLNADGRTEPGR